jgi:chromosome segregation ATPase
VKTTQDVTQDKNDVIDFLRLQVLQGERNLADMTKRMQDVELERDQIRERIIAEKNLEMHDTKVELDEITDRCTKYKIELDQLAEFRLKKDSMERQLQDLARFLENKDKECKEVIHNLERKTIQDKVDPLEILYFRALLERK